MTISDLQIDFLQNAGMEAHDRLKIAREQKYATAKLAAQALGVPYGTYSGHEAGSRGFKKPEAEFYAKKYKVRLAWLLTGEEPMSGQPLVQSYDPDTPEDADDDTRPPFPADGISELVSKAGLGSGQFIETTYSRLTPGGETTQSDAIRDDYWRLPGYFIREGFQTRVADLLVIQGEGDSMAPTVANNDRVFVNTAHRVPTPDGLYAIRDQFDAVIVKRLEMAGTDRVNVISDNPKHTPRERDLSEIEIVGRVVGVLKLT